MFVMDLQGLETIARIYPKAQTIFVIAPIKDLIRRINVRPMDEVDCENRKQKLAREIMDGINSSFVRNVVYNKDGDFIKTVQQISEIIAS